MCTGYYKTNGSIDSDKRYSFNCICNTGCYRFFVPSILMYKVSKNFLVEWVVLPVCSWHSRKEHSYVFNSITMARRFIKFFLLKIIIFIRKWEEFIPMCGLINLSSRIKTKKSYLFVVKCECDCFFLAMVFDLFLWEKSEVNHVKIRRKIFEKSNHYAI